MLYESLIIFLVTLIPTLELRASIPFGIFLGVDWQIVFFVAVISNILLAGLVWIFVNYLMDIFLRIKFVRKYYDTIIFRTQKKVEPYVERFGVFGLALFIGIPLPGSGVYTGGLGAYLLGYRFKDYFVASVLGVLIAGIVVVSIVLSGTSAYQLFIKPI